LDTATSIHNGKNVVNRKKTLSGTKYGGKVVLGGQGNPNCPEKKKPPEKLSDQKQKKKSRKNKYQRSRPTGGEKM